MILKPNYWAVSLSGLDCKAKLVSEIIFKYLGTHTTVECYSGCPWACPALKSEVGKLTVKGQIANIWGFVGHMGSVSTPQLYCCNVRVATDELVSRLCANKTLRTLEFESDIVFISQNSILPLMIFQSFKNVKTYFWVCRPYKNSW